MIKELTKQAMTKWGMKWHLDLLQEESGELIASINHYRRQKPLSFIKMMEEMVDVELVHFAVKQEIMSTSDRYEYLRIKREKIKRLKGLVYGN